MQKTELRNKLTASLVQLYGLEAIGGLAEFLQGELHVLHFLCNHRDVAVNPSMLSDELFVSRSRITAALSTLRVKGYITMEISEEDRRRMRVLLTDSGEVLIRRKQDDVEKYFDLLVEGLGEVNVLDLIRLIDLSVETMNNSFPRQRAVSGNRITD